MSGHISNILIDASYLPKFSENKIIYLVLLVIFMGALFKMSTIYGVDGDAVMALARTGRNMVFNNPLGGGESNYEIIFGIIGVFSFVAYQLWLWHKKNDADAAKYAKSESKTASVTGGKCKGIQPEQVSLGDGNKVFHVPNQIFEYSEADKVCKSLTVDSKGATATVQQLKGAWENDKANWCSYGWTKGGYALYPVQPEFFNRIQGQDKCKYNCGDSPGIKGGKILLDKNTDTNKNKFGINCYGKLKDNEIDIKKGREYSIPCEGPAIDKLKKETYPNLEIIVGSNIYNQKKV
jgi:hypothetical protein